MLNVACPTRDEVDDLNNIIEEKNTGLKKATLKALGTRIISRYSDFSQIETGNRITTVPYTIDEKEALLSLYSSKTATANSITDAILRAQIAKQAGSCLSCGINEVDQIDHFLPQTYFPEYSIFHKNLTPICGKCNEIKGDSVPGVDKDFIHTMFDQIPVEMFLSCRIDYKSHIPVAHFSILPKFDSHRIKSHFINMKLEARLQKKSTQYFLLVNSYKTDFGDLFAKEEIDRDLKKIEMGYGIFFWKYLLCHQMNDTSFVDQIIESN